jgi:ethanolamine ammonia-lyase small subunit
LELERPDAWAAMRALTPARIGLGAAGAALPTGAHLDFQLAHARARDAVHHPFDAASLAAALAAAGHRTIDVRSAAPDRDTYLRRPDLGRQLDAPSRAALAAARDPAGADLAFVVADGLSALAVERHALPLLDRIFARVAPAAWRVAPIAIARQARVALGDEIGAALGASLVAVLIGERPGLSSPDSLGVYLTWDPRVGRTDAERNCLSNIRPAGLDPEPAAHRLWYLMREATRRRLTGVALKEESAALTLPRDDSPSRTPS